MEVERSIQNIHLDQEQLLDLLRQAFPDCQKVQNWEILSGGALNTTYKFQIEDRAFILRIYARDRAHCKTEQALHQLIDKKVSTPQLIYANPAHTPWAFAIFEFIPGIHISEVLEKDKEALSFELGRVLASIHAFTFPEAGLFGDGLAIGHPFMHGSTPYFEEAFSVLTKGKNVRERLGNSLADEILAFMQQNRDFFPVVRNNICLTHSDFKPVNPLYNQEKIFVLDWEFAHAGIGILDFAILLRHRDQFPLDIIALETGYKDSGGHLPPEWKHSALVTDFVNILTLMETPPERPKLFDQLRKTMQRTIKNWEL